MTRRAWIIALYSLSLLAQDFRKLPDWAAREALAASMETAPTEADAWVLLDRTEFTYVGNGEIRMHRFRVVKVLDDRGLEEAYYSLRSLGGKASKVKRLKGWNLRPDGELIRLDTDSAVTVDGDTRGEISTSVVTGAQLYRAVKGSILAFESLESLHHPMGPTAIAGIMEEHPVRRWELEAIASGGWFTSLKDVAVKLDTRHLEPWISTPEVIPGKSVKATSVPAIPKQEDAAPYARNALPSVLVRFQDPAFLNTPSTETWDELAKWVDAQYQVRFQPSRPIATGGKGTRESLQAIHNWMAKEFTYKQVYVSPERGWLPDPGPEVVRHRYGDCKDLTCCLLSEAKGIGLEVHPVMALIGHGFIEEGEAPSFTTFDHVISAIKLPASLGFPAEVDTPQGHFLLVDPTSRLTPLGLLPASHRDRRVMICTPGGAAWVRVPVSATQRPSSIITIDGEIDAVRNGTAKVAVQETANHLGLREALLTEGTKGLRVRLFTFLDLSPTASLEIESVGDPLDLDKPFLVSTKLVQADALRLEGKDEVLVSWGMPTAPRLIQKSGQRRQFPVVSTRQGRLEFKATYRFPFAVKPLLPKADLETPFRTLHWVSQSTAEAGKNSVSIGFTQEFRPVYFDFKEREKGATAWKNERSQILRLRSDGLAFNRIE
ncbi:MAG TPA: hypothetical protein VJ486_07065 [Geothrix sp.]|nr:hypothetical protein [Geothrix sp.]